MVLFLRVDRHAWKNRFPSGLPFLRTARRRQGGWKVVLTGGVCQQKRIAEFEAQRDLEFSQSSYSKLPDPFEKSIILIKTM